MGPALGQLTIQREQTLTASPDPCCVLLLMCPLCYSLIRRTEHPEGLWEACADPQNSTPTIALPVPGGARHFSSGLFSKFLGVLPVGISTETQNIPRAESRCSLNVCQMKTLGKLLSPQHIPSDSQFTCSALPKREQKMGPPPQPVPVRTETTAGPMPSKA